MTATKSVHCLAAILAASLAIAATNAAATELLINGGFEDGGYSSTLGGHTNPNVPVDWVPNAAFDLEPTFNHVDGGTPRSGLHELSISNFDSEPVAGLSQSFNDVAGATYTVSFWAYDAGTFADPAAFVDVAAGGHHLSFDDTHAFPYSNGVFTFLGSGHDTLTITATTQSAEWYVDDVSVAGETGGHGGVPEPGAWSLLILGFAGLGGALRRARGAAAAI